MVDLHIYVARHGQDIDNSNGILNGHRDQPLTELGREQARNVAAKMKKAGFMTDIAISHNKVLNAIYSSPLQRAHDTAKIFATELNSISHLTTYDDMTVHVLNDLIERDFGIMTGQATSSIVEKCGKDHILATEHINYFLDPKGAETFPDLIIRAKRLLVHLQEIAIAENDVFADSSSEDATTTTTAAATKRSILLVTHGDFGKMIYAAYYNLQWEDVLRQFHFGNSEVLLLSKDSPPEKAHLFETLQFNA